MLVNGLLYKDDSQVWNKEDKKILICLSINGWINSHINEMRELIWK